MTTTVINATNPTLLDLAQRTDPNGNIATLVEVLAPKLALFKDATWVEGNLPTGHQFASQAALPSVGWRRFNEGVTAGKTRADVVTDTCGMLEGRSQVDCELAKLNGNEAAFRASELKGFMTAMFKEAESSAFYASTKTAPEKIMGLSPRLDALSGIPFYGQVMSSDISSSGSDQTSVWLINWSPETVFFITPKGSTAGITTHDMGEQMIADANSKRFRAYETVVNWKFGLCVKDARYLVRIANVDTSAIVGTGQLLITSMIKAVHKLQDMDTGRPAFYMNRTVATYLHLQSQASTLNSTITFDNIGGHPVMQFMGIPCRITDSLVNTEAVVA